MEVKVWLGDGGDGGGCFVCWGERKRSRYRGGI